MAKNNKKFFSEQKDRLSQVRRLLISKKSEEARHNLEKKILGKGSLIKDPKGVDALRFTQLTPDAFHNKINKLIFNFEKKSFNEGQVVSFETMKNVFSSNENTQEIFHNAGENKYLYELIRCSNGSRKDLVETINQLEMINNKNNIIEKSLNMINDITSNLNDASEDQIGSIKAQVAELNKEVAQLQDEEGLNKTHNLSELFEEFSQNLYEARRDGRGKIGKHTGFDKLDEAINGFRDGQMVVIGARPGVGKTAFSLNLVERFLHNDTIRQTDSLSAEVKEEVPQKMTGIFFSLEMGSSELLERLIAERTAIEVPMIRDAQINDSDWVDILATIATDDTKGRFFINDNPSLTIDDIEQEIEKTSRNVDHLDFVFVDYLQLVNSTNQNRQQAIAETSRRLKVIAKQYHTTVFAIAQLNREVEHRDNNRPGLADLRESGQIEQDADIVIMLSEDPMLAKENSKSDSNEDNGEQEFEDDPDIKVNLEIVKNRSGQRRLIPFVFRRPINTFSELTEEEDEEYFNYNKKQNTKAGEVVTISEDDELIKFEENIGSDKI